MTASRTDSGKRTKSRRIEGENGVDAMRERQYVDIAQEVCPLGAGDRHGVILPYELVIEPGACMDGGIDALLAAIEHVVTKAAHADVVSASAEKIIVRDGVHYSWTLTLTMGISSFSPSRSHSSAFLDAKIALSSPVVFIPPREANSRSRKRGSRAATATKPSLAG